MSAASTVRKRTSSSNETSGPNSRSTLSAPTVVPASTTGTPMKEMVFLAMRGRAPVRLRNRGSACTSGTMQGEPVENTWP